MWLTILFLIENVSFKIFKMIFYIFNSFLVKLNWVSRTFNCVGEWTSWSYFDLLEQNRFKCKIKMSGHLAILICFVIDCFLSHFSLFKIRNSESYFTIHMQSIKILYRSKRDFRPHQDVLFFGIHWGTAVETFDQR